MFIIAFKTKSGYLLGLGAIYADNSRWIRWGIPSVINAKDYPRVIVYNTRKEARDHANYVMRRAKQLEIHNIEKSEIIPVYSISPRRSGTS